MASWSESDTISRARISSKISRICSSVILPSFPINSNSLSCHWCSYTEFLMVLTSDVLLFVCISCLYDRNHDWHAATVVMPCFRSNGNHCLHVFNDVFNRHQTWVTFVAPVTLQCSSHSVLLSTLFLLACLISCLRLTSHRILLPSALLPCVAAATIKSTRKVVSSSDPVTSHYPTAWLV